MRKYRLSTNYRGPRKDLIDYVGLSSIYHYNKHVQDGGQSLNSNLNKVYIRNFYEYHHRKRPGEGKTAKQEYDKELKEENKKQRLKAIESQVSFDRTSSSSFDSTEDDDQATGAQVNGQVNGLVNGKTNGYLPKTKLSNGNCLQNGHSQTGNDNQLTNGFKSKTRKSTKQYNRTKGDRNSKDFFDALLSNKKSHNIENEYKKCVKICKELCLAKQIQAYQLETLTDSYDSLEDTYNELYQKYKFINRECKLIEKDIERLKTDYCRLVKQDLIKKNNLIKENNYIPIYDEIPSIELDIFGDLKNYERAYDKYNWFVDYEEYKRLNKMNTELFLKNNLTNGSCDSLQNLKDDLVDENNNKIKIEVNGHDYLNKKTEKVKENKNNDKNAEEEKNKKKQQVEDVLYLLISRPDCGFFCDKISQLVQDNAWLKSKIKRLQFDITNEKRKNAIRKDGGQQSNGVVEFEFSDNLNKQKPVSRNTRHTINVINSRPFPLANSTKSPLTSSSRNLSNSSSSRNLSINKFGSRICSLNVFEIPTKKVEIFQMKLKMQQKESELQIGRLRKMKELLDNKFELQKKSLKDSQQNTELLEDEQTKLSNQVKQLKIREQQLFKENENLMKKVNRLTEK